MTTDPAPHALARHLQGAPHDHARERARDEHVRSTEHPRRSLLEQRTETHAVRRSESDETERGLAEHHACGDAAELYRDGPEHVRQNVAKDGAGEASAQRAR